MSFERPNPGPAASPGRPVVSPRRTTGSPADRRKRHGCKGIGVRCRPSRLWRSTRRRVSTPGRDSRVREDAFASTRTVDREGGFAVDGHVDADVPALHGAASLATRDDSMLLARHHGTCGATIEDVLVAVGWLEDGDEAQ